MYGSNHSDNDLLQNVVASAHTPPYFSSNITRIISDNAVLFISFLSKKMSFILYVDTQHHSISKCLPPLIHPYTKIIETYPIPIIHDLDYYIQSTNKDLLYFSSTTYLHHTIMPDCSSFIRKILEPPQSMLKRLPTNITTVVHVQINEPIISKFKYPHLSIQ